MGENIDIGQLRKRREPDRWPAVIGEDEKGRPGRTKNSVIRNPVHDRAHAVLANAEVNVATALRFAGEIAAVLDVVQRRSVKISAPTDEKRHRLGERLESVAAGFAGRDLCVSRKRRNLRE